MTYDVNVKKYNRIPVAFIELDVDFCALRSGVGACTATQTGDDKCYNTYASCNDAANFDKTVKTYRFCEQNSQLPVGLSAIPLIKNITFASQQITPNKGLGIRGSVSVSFFDGAWPDTEIDPYFRERSAPSTGTFWGKFLARNPYYENRILRVRRGYLTTGFNIDDCLDSVYVIDQLNGISKSDDVSIVAKDMLKLADDKKALFPAPSNGRLSADISNSATSFTLSPSGVGSQYKTSGKCAISGELMSYTRSGDTFTVTRGVSNTTAEAHTAEDTVQEVGIFVNEKIQDVVYELFTSYAEISTDYIDKDQWDDEANNYLAGVWSAEIPEPTGINTLVGELTEQANFRVWWDEIEQTIPFRAVKPLPEDLPVLTDNINFLDNSVDVKRDTNQRISTVLIYFAQKKPTEKLDDQKNYELRVATPNVDAISANKYGTNVIKKIYSRWLKKTSQGRANALADAILKSFADPPRIIEFSLSPALQLKVGDLFIANTRKLQALSGAYTDVPFEVVLAQPTANDDIKYKAQEVSTAIPIGNTFKIILSDSLYLDFNLYDAFIDEYGIPESGITVEVEILEGVLITGSTTANYAFTNPNTWPSGVVIKLTKNLGVISGRGGNGGSGIIQANTIILATNGQDGGLGMLIEYPIEVDNQGGFIKGGAAGSGAGGSVLAFDQALINYWFVGGGGGSGGWPLGLAGNGAKALDTTSGIWTVRNGNNGNNATSNTNDVLTTVFGGFQGNGVFLSNGATLLAGDGGDTNSVFANGQNGDIAQVLNNPSGGGLLSGISPPSQGGQRGDAIHGDALITWVNTGTIYGNIVP